MNKLRILPFIVILLLGNSLVIYGDNNRNLEKRLDKIISEQEEFKAKLDDVSEAVKRLRIIEETFPDSLEAIAARYDKLEKNLEFLTEEVKAIKRYSSQKRRQLQAAVDRLSVLSDSLRSVGYSLNKDIESIRAKSSREISRLDKVIATRESVGVVVFLVILIALVVIYASVMRRQLTQKAQILDEIEKARDGLQEEGIRIDNKLVELLEKQFDLLQKQEELREKEDMKREPDHSLALVIANEITRLENNLMRMDENIRGYKQLKAVVRRMKDGLSAKGYEIMELLGRAFQDELNIEAIVIPSDKTERGKRVISKIITPQVYYQGKRIQVAQVEVNQGV